MGRWCSLATRLSNVLISLPVAFELFCRILSAHASVGAWFVGPQERGAGVFYMKLV